MIHTTLLVAAAMIGAQPPDVSPMDTLIDALRDTDMEVRHYAGVAIAQIGPSAIEPLKKALSDKDRNLRSGAAYTLGQFGATAAPAREALLKALKDDDRDVRRQAAYAVSRIMVAEREALEATPAAPVPAFPSDPTVKR